MKQTHIPGKDDSLENAILRMSNALKENGFNIVEHSWGNPAPNIWWVHIRDADNPMCFTNGKGGSKLAALASALGEFIERLSCNYFFADYYWGKNISSGNFVHYPNEKWFAIEQGTLGSNCPNGLLNKKLVEFYDPNKELSLDDLQDINAGKNERGICAIPFSRQRDDETTYFPVNIIGNLYVSNGMAAGNTKVEARTQALSEIFERWIKNQIIAEEIALPTIPNAVIERYPNIVAGLTEMYDQGYVIQVFDASLGGKFPVIGAALLNPLDGGCLTSFGAHPNFSVALERTITELLQGRELKNLGEFPAPSFDSEWLSDAHNLETHFIDSTGLVSWRLFSDSKDYSFSEWDFSSETTEEEYLFLLNLLQEVTDVYIADYEYLGFYACRVLAPGVSEIYPFEELIHYNNNVANIVREVILQLPNTNHPDNFEFVLEWLDKSGLDDSERLPQVLGLSIEQSNPWHSVRLGELRCYLYLAIRDWQNALEMTEWVMTFAMDTMPIDKQCFFACLKAQLAIIFDETLKAEDFETIHCQVFGKAIYESVTSHLQVKKVMNDLTAENLHLSTFANHQQWLSRYRIWQKAKV